MNCISGLVVNNKEFLPSCLGGNGRNKALALLGDRLLDLALYTRLVRLGLTDEGVMTQHRSMVVANANLAICAERYLVPDALSSSSFRGLSIHERGTLIEAFMGALFEQQSYVIDSVVHNACEEVVDFLRQSVVAGDDTGVVAKQSFAADPDDSAGRVQNSVSEFKVKSAMKKSKSALLELLQKRGIPQGSSFFTVRAASPHHPHLPPFVSTFEPTFSLACCGLPDTGPISGDVCMTKKDADESASSKVLQFFREKERQSANSAGEVILSTTDAPRHPPSEASSNVVNRSGTSIASNAPDADSAFVELEDGEEVEDESELIEKREIETKRMKEEIAEKKRRAENRRLAFRRTIPKSDSALQEQVVLGETVHPMISFSKPNASTMSRFKAPHPLGNTFPATDQARPHWTAPNIRDGGPRPVPVANTVDGYPMHRAPIGASLDNDFIFNQINYIDIHHAGPPAKTTRAYGPSSDRFASSPPYVRIPVHGHGHEHASRSGSLLLSGDGAAHAYGDSMGGDFYEALARGAEAARIVRARVV
jgi:hypothetical protein